MRRAEERVRVWGASGGKSVWKAFMTSGRCGGVVGEGGGKDARTSWSESMGGCERVSVSERKGRVCDAPGAG